MEIKAIITGSSGMVGRGILLECLENERVISVLVINRKPIGIKHEKIKEIILEDFFNLDPIKEELKGFNACFFCIGVSSAGMSEDKYSRITFNLTINFAEALVRLNPEMTFCYVSGAGTDSSEKGKTLWARIKGKTENTLMNLPFKSCYMFRPAFIQPKKGIRSRTAVYNVLYFIFSPFYPFIKRFKKYVTSTDKLAKAMIFTVLNNEGSKIIENIDINRIAEYPY